MSMSTVGDVSGTALDQYQIKNQNTANKELGKNEFLNLLVAQLNNQNPLEPQGNGEFIAQLAQFSQVECIEKLNTSESFKASLVLPTSSSNVYVNVYDSAGAVVSRVNLGEQKAGNVSFIWDGKDSGGNLMPPGTYKFEAQATYDGEAKGLYTLLPANVDSVVLGGSELMLNLAGLGSVPLSQVQVIGQ